MFYLLLKSRHNCYIFLCMNHKGERFCVPYLMAFLKESMLALLHCHSNKQSNFARKLNKFTRISVFQYPPLFSFTLLLQLSSSRKKSDCRVIEGELMFNRTLLSFPFPYIKQIVTSNQLFLLEIFQSNSLSNTSFKRTLVMERC